MSTSSPEGEQEQLSFKTWHTQLVVTGAPVQGEGRTGGATGTAELQDLAYTTGGDRGACSGRSEEQRGCAPCPP
eukprot:1150968-Pelagomonas_calceolata.AAC.5